VEEKLEGVNMRQGKFFVNNWIFGDCEIEQVFERVSKIGYDGIELVGEPGIYHGRSIVKLASVCGLKICSICGMFPGPEKDDLRALAHPEKKERKKAIEYIKRCIDLAKSVDARSVLVVPGLVGRPELFVSKDIDFKTTVDSIAEAAPYAESNKMYLTIEPINRYEVGLINSISEAIKMAKEINSPYVKIMGDTFHMQIEEPDGIPDAIRRAGKHWLYHMHAADNTRQAPGRGTMDWRKILRSLYDIDYTGVISLEPLPKGASPYDARTGKIPAEILDRELSFALEYLKLQESIVMEHL